MPERPSGQTDDLDRLRGLSVAVVSDILDSLGHTRQMLDSRLRPLAGPLPLVGRAFPIQAVATPIIGDSPYAEEIAAVDALRPASIAVVAADGNCTAALWGELLATRAVARGAVGAVIDGAIRDLAGLRQMDFPTFSVGIAAADARGRLSVVAHGSPVCCGGVVIHPTDLILGDLDGLVAIPQGVAAAVLEQAERKRASELQAQHLLTEGVSVAEVYDRLNVL